MKISIIVPIYNVEEYLGRCINSLVNQTYENIEVILIDDGSPDNCGEMCDKWAQKDARIIVVHKKNGGLSDTRNVGIDVATGDLLMFIDSDDYIRVDMVEVLYNKLIEANADIAICDLLYVDELGNNILDKNTDSRIKDEVITNIDVFNKLTQRHAWCYCIACNKLYKKETFKNIKFPIGKLHEDEFTVYRILDNAEIVVCISVPMYYYVQRENSITQSKYSIRRLDVCEALVERSMFFVDKKMYDCAKGSLRTAVSILIGARKKLSKEDLSSKRYKEVVKLEKKHYIKILKFNKSLKYFIHGALFVFNVKIYTRILDIVNRH
ncbi:MAG: glycosyltransferase family 2 protein [Bacillota bacterium]